MTIRHPRSQLALAAVALLLGFLLVVQLNAQQAGTGLATRSSQDLTLLIANLTTRNDQLRADLDRVRRWAGLDAAAGPGVRVLLFGGVPASAVSDLLNELRNAGAEAIAVGGVRVVAGTVVAGPTGSLSVENTALGPRIEVLAIGSPPALTGALTRPGGLVAQLRGTYDEVAVEVTPLDTVEVPAAERPLVPLLGQPRP